MTQYVIDTGEFPNDGTGDPLRTAFEYVNLNFDQIFNAGPVLSNIVIENNTIYSINTNGNIVLNPNGIGNVIANAHVIPDQTRVRNLGSPNLKWDTVYAQYLVGDGNGISNVTAANISNGTARVDAYFNSNVAVSAGGTANVAIFTVGGLTVPGNILAGSFVGNVNTTNISGQSVTISATGANQGISLLPNGTGNVSVNFKHIVNLAEPVNPQDAATKYYVDTTAEGLDVKASCLLATTSALPAYTYNNGISGIGATITANAVGLLSVDSTAVVANARILVKNESSANEPYNGIYVVANTGNATTAFQLIRSTDFDNGAPSGEIPGAFTFIETGASNADSGWVCTTNNPVAVGVTPIVWTQFSGAGAYMAGQGLDLIGGTFNALVDNNTTEINLSNQIAVKAGANLVTPNIGAATGTSLSVTGSVSANSINTSGAISTTANITGGNLLTSGQLSATGSITGGNVFTGGYISSTGQIVTPSNITGGNINTAGQLSAAGNVTGGNLVTSNSVVANNITASATISAVGNISGNNVTAANAVTALTASVTGNIESGNILNSGIISATGNVTGGNLRTAGQITATGNLTVGNVRTAGLVSAAGEIISNSNITGANITANGIVTASGNIISDQYFIGNGAFLTGIDATSIQNGNSNVRVLANANVTVGVAGTSNVAVFANSGVYVSGTVSATGNITGANISTENVTATGNVTAGNVISNTLTGSNVAVISSGNLILSATGNISVGNTYITNLANPVNLQDAATKYYVDSVATGLDPKESVVYATASALGVPYTYNNGTGGVGATLTSNLPGALTIDGNTVQAGQRVLIKNETGAFSSNTVPSAAFNGIYDVSIAGDVGNAWVLIRSADFDQPTEMASSFTFVEEGGTNADTGWVCVTNNPITIGFTSIVFTQFSGAGAYTAGNGLSLNGTVFSVNTDGNIAINGSNQVSIANGATLNSPNITTATATSLSATGNVTGGNIIFGSGIISGTGNIYANKIFANIQGNVDAAGNLYEVQFNTTGDQLGASANFTYDSANNALTVNNGNINGGNVNTSNVWASGDLTLAPVGNIVLDGGKYINNLLDPVQAQDAATKEYVDNAVSAGLTIHEPVLVESPTALNGTYAQGGTTYTVTDTIAGNTVVFSTVAGLQTNDQLWFSNSFEGILANTAYFVVSTPNTSAAVLSLSYSGAPVTTITSNTGLTQSVRVNSGIGATLTNAGANATLQIDGVTLANTNRVLIYQQANAAHNGVYVVSEAGNATTAWQLTRSTDTNRYGPKSTQELDAGDYFYVTSGSTGAGESYVLTEPTGPIIIGYNNLTFTQFSASQVYTANTAAGLSLTGTVFSAKVDNNTTAFDINGNIIVKPSANLTTPNIGAATGTSLSVSGNIVAGNKVIPAVGNVDVANVYINNVVDPVQPQDAATKLYVDTVAGGVTANVLGNLINMGSNTQGQLISNAVTLTTSTKVTDGIALLNQVLGKLVPPAPPAFPAGQNIAISSTSTYRMANITQVNNTANSLTVAAGATVTTVRRVATYATNTITTAGPGDAGTVTTYRNGVAVGNVTLNPAATPSANGTYGGGNLVISNNFDYNSANANIAAGFWYVFSAGISGSSAPAGWNDIVIFDTSAGNTNIANWYYDASSPSTPSYSSTTMTPPGSSTLLYSSTVPHYTNVNQFTIGTTVANVSGNLYPTSNVMATGTSAGSFAAPASVTYAQSNLGTNVIASFATASFTTTSNVTTGFGGSSTGPSIAVNNSYSTGTLTLTTALGNTVLYKSGTATAIDEGNIVVTTVGTGSGNAVRIVNPGTGNTPSYTANAATFNSQSSTLQTYDATVVGTGSQGVLKHDQTNYSTGYLPAGPDLSTGRSGTQYFTFKFVRTDVSKFDITYAGNVAGMWVALPGSVIDSSSGANGWINMAVAYAGAGYPGVNTPGNGSDGCALGGTVSLNTTVASTSKTCTFGTVSSSSTVTNEIYVRIALTSGQTVTGLSLKAASN
jgi:hypothetical protein